MTLDHYIYILRNAEEPQNREDLEDSGAYCALGIAILYHNQETGEALPFTLESVHKVLPFLTGNDVSRIVRLNDRDELKFVQIANILAKSASLVLEPLPTALGDLFDRLAKP